MKNFIESRSIKSDYEAYAVPVIRWFDRLITGKVISVLFFGVVVGWVVYGLLGHRVIAVMYSTTSGHILGDVIMASKRSTPLEAYLDAADTMIVVSTVRLFTLLLLAALVIKKPLALLYGPCLVALGSFFLFCAVELFPALGDFLYLDKIDFYQYNKLYIADDTLVHKLRPHLRTHTRARQYDYPPLYGIEVQPTTIDWLTDEDGFRNGGTKRFNDIIVIGDGFIEDGQSLDDTFPNRLEKHFSGITVRNLGTGGYGPFQYLEVLNRYGIKRNPKYALIAFNEVNELIDIETYLRWRKGKGAGLRELYDAKTGALSKPFFNRYTEMLVETARHIQKVAVAMAYDLLEKLNMYGSRPVHPDVVVVEIGKKATYKMLFIDRLIPESAEEILASNNGRHLKEILIEFKELCVRNKIVPLIMFIPSAAHIYAQYSTEMSGRNWLKVRADQIAAKQNVQHAISTLARALDIELIDLSHSFESAAKDGKMLYRPLSTHWNSEGMEVAARIVKGALEPKISVSGK